jgi:hypothetical protein
VSKVTKEPYTQTLDSAVKYGATTLRIMTLITMTFITMTLITMTLITTTLSMNALHTECCYAEGHKRAIMLSVDMLSVVALQGQSQSLR